MVRRVYYEYDTYYVGWLRNLQRFSSKPKGVSEFSSSNERILRVNSRISLLCKGTVLIRKLVKYTN